MTRPMAADRLRRVLALVPYIVGRDDVSIAELASAFGVPEKVIESDLEILPFCGLPPYTPDRLIDVAIVDGHVSLRFAEYFSRPLRLTPAEGFALLAAGRGLLSVPGSDSRGPLGSALDKLEQALGGEALVEVDVGNPGDLEGLRAASEARQRLEIDYYSFGRDAVTTRRVDPLAVVSMRGNWYLAAYCHQAADERLFRVDRIRAVRQTGEHFEAPRAGASAEVPADAFSPSEADTVVTLDLPASAGWVAESYPVLKAEERPRGRTRVVLAVSAHPWLERLLLAVGPGAKVVSPRSLKDTAANAAKRVLAAYDG
ncbi:MAG: WYL domain-containing protein [Actinobacteria bacterium]|nr:WYL domain-containing protein [Actinomycetota bacterium]